MMVRGGRLEALGSRLSVRGLLEVCSVILCVATATSFLARRWWVFELTSHFREHMAVGLFALATIWAVIRHSKLTVICGVCAVIHGVAVAPQLWPNAERNVEGEAAGGTRLRLAALNVYSGNQRTDLVLELLRATDADVILLMEVNRRWLEALSPLCDTYPHRVTKPRQDNFGIALYSRLPLTRALVLELGDAQVPSIAAHIHVGEQEVFFLGTHPLPPGTAESSFLRNEQLQQIAAYVRGQDAPRIVLGDLNVTPWSPYFADLLRDSGLKDTSRGRGRFGSWPATLPLGRIALDHCLVSPSLGVLDKRLGPNVGSDHLPVVVDLQLPPPTSADRPR